MTKTTKIDPSCRYGHGHMDMATHNPDSPSAALFGLHAIGPLGIPDMGISYVLNVYKCRQCSYVELHDVPHDTVNQLQIDAISRMAKAGAE